MHDTAEKVPNPGPITIAAVQKTDCRLEKVGRRTAETTNLQCGAISLCVFFLVRVKNYPVILGL